MPNDCYNRLIITSTDENNIINMLDEISNTIPHVTIKQKMKYALMLEFITPWEPNIQLIDKLVRQYPLSWIKNEWNTEDGKSGIWVGSKNNIKYMDWRDLSLEDMDFFFRK